MKNLLVFSIFLILLLATASYADQGAKITNFEPLQKSVPQANASKKPGNYSTSDRIYFPQPIQSSPISEGESKKSSSGPSESSSSLPSPSMEKILVNSTNTSREPARVPSVAPPVSSTTPDNGSNLRSDQNSNYTSGSIAAPPRSREFTVETTSSSQSSSPEGGEAYKQNQEANPAPANSISSSSGVSSSPSSTEKSQSSIEKQEAPNKGSQKKEPEAPNTKTSGSKEPFIKRLLSWFWR